MFVFPDFRCNITEPFAGIERKYDTSLRVLEQKVTRLEAVQTLSRPLVQQSAPSAALDSLLELSIRHMGVEKAIGSEKRLDSNVEEHELECAERFAAGLACYRSGQFRDARPIFAECLVRTPHAPTAR